MQTINTQYKFSLFENLYKAEKPTREIDINELVEIIKYGYLRDVIERLRATVDKDIIHKIKTSELPCVTISGVFKQRRNDGLVKHSGLIQVDLDEVRHYESAFAEIVHDPHTYVCFRSPRGHGIKVIIKINPSVETHREQFNAIERYYKEEFNIEIDKVCKDVSRAMLLSYDPNIYCNPHSDVYAELYAPEQTSKPTIKSKVTISNTGDDHEVIDKLISELESRRIDITANYHDWIKIGFALVNTFGESGREYFHRIGAMYPDYTSGESDMQYSQMLKKNKGGINFATIIYHAKQHGVEVHSEPIVKLQSKDSTKSID